MTGIAPTIPATLSSDSGAVLARHLSEQAEAYRVESTHATHSRLSSVSTMRPGDPRAVNPSARPVPWRSLAGWQGTGSNAINLRSRR